MFELFKAKAAGVGAEVHRLATTGEALEFISSFLQQEGVADHAGAYATWATSPCLAGLPPEALPAQPGLSFQVTRQRAAQTKVGISQAQFAVADTGSLVLDQSAPEQRLVSSLPSIHIALLATGNILPDKPALFARMNPSHSRYIAFITGPSRTADIERVLTIGVHGPSRFVIIAVDEELKGGAA
jgi:L-lactate dehydrogenase complex protein LldG